MYIVHVHVRVKPEYLRAFKNATITNAQKSLMEPGIARFDVIQQIDDPNRFVLVEVYRTIDDPAKHKATKHYKVWSDIVVVMMAEPRQSEKFENIFPEESGW